MSEPVGLANTALPLTLIFGAAVALPRVLVSRAARSHRKVAVAIVATAVLVQVLTMAMFGWLYSGRGADVWGALIQAPVATALYFFDLSKMAVLAWGPVLALVWLTMAHRVERLRGEDIARANGGDGA
jgi:hypothetical protein